MRFALVNNERCEAEPKLIGICPLCNEPVIAKCGTKKAHHWAHKSLINCDPWWENETNWHISWKNRFPKECQEVIMHNTETNEKHIADIHLHNKFTIEFQHSPISPTEMLSRERFYKEMVWVVDGARRKRDFNNFIKGRKTLISQQHLLNIYKFDSLDNIIPEDWNSCTVPVVFDFLGTPAEGELVDARKLSIYCLLPQKVHGYSCLFETTRETFIGNTVSGGWQIFIKRQMDILISEARSRF